MVIRPTNQKTAKQISTVDTEIKKAHPLIKNLISEFRKENARLQRLIAKNQVAYESETNRIRAQLKEKAAPRVSFVIHSPSDKKHK